MADGKPIGDATGGPGRGTIGGAAAKAASTALTSDFALGRLVDAFRPPHSGELLVSVRRPDDMLVFNLLVENLRLVRGQSPVLARVKAGQQAVLIVEFPPQHIAEEAFLEVVLPEPDLKKQEDRPPGLRHDTPQPGEPVPPLPSARTRMSGPSRLAFTMPAGVSDLPFTLAAVLAAMREWPLRLDICAVDDPALGGRSEWLRGILDSVGLKAAKASLVSGLVASGARGIGTALESAADRVAARIAGGIVDPSPEAVGRVAFELVQDEFGGLTKRFAALREGPAHQAALAALAMAVTEALVPATARMATSVHASLVSAIPYLPLLIAPHAPPGNVTALELPYRLILTPIENARWQHADATVGHNDRVELWHTRLRTAPGASGGDGLSKVRAFWSPDYPITDFNPLAGPPPLPFRMSLDPLDRQMLVKNMAGFTERTAEGRWFRPRSTQAKRLHLTSLGGLLDGEGHWDPRPDGVDLEQWKHQAAVGRDHYVRVVYAGYLCSFGHAASLVKVTERKFESLGGDPNKRIAVLRQRFFIVVRERVKTYSPSDHVHGGRNFPFTQIEVLTRVTPNLADPASTKVAEDPADPIFGGAIVGRMAFWPTIPGPSGQPQLFGFQVVGTDRCGNRVTFAVPQLFVSEIPNQQKPGPVRKAYNRSGEDHRSAQLGNATVCFAPFDPAAKGDTNLPTGAMVFTAGDPTAVSMIKPNYFPEMARAHLGIPPLQKLLGQPNATADVAYPTVYRDHGFDPAQNAGEVFLQLVNSAYALTFGGGGSQAKSDALGGLAAPQMAIQGLSRVMGPVAAKPPAGGSPTPAQIEAALAKVIGNQFDPTDFFKGATILGGVDLGTILDVAAGLAGADVPKLVSRQIPGPDARVEASFDWETKVTKSDPLNLLLPNADSGEPETTLVMKGLVTTPLGDPSKATYEARASLNNFKVNLFGFVIVWFEDLRFVAAKGQKPDVTVRLRDGDDAVQFGGPLEFVNELRSIIPSNGFSDPPGITVTPSGITASYSLTLPTIGVGIFTLSGLSLGAGFSLPFDATPAAVKFNFSERQHPFSLTVSLLGGGGFFAIAVIAKGVQEIEAALEFGAALAIDLGVASGGVEIKAGVYFHWLQTDPAKAGSVQLTGYVRMHGELSVLGLISASLTFNLQLSYEKASGESKVWGEATLSVEIEILFFSFSVSVSCRKDFAGSKSDPKFLDLVPDQSTWSEYCDAFAPEAV